MQKTREEIKDGLYWCSQHVDSMDCEKCSYYNNKDCVDNMCSDAAGLVKQLEAELEDMTARYKIADDCAKKKGEMNEKLYAELTAVKAERDAAVRDVRKWCCTCKHCAKEVREAPCNSCRRNGQGGTEECWQWRGVQKEG